MTAQAETQERILAMLRQVFERHRGRLRGYRILLFGSRATGRARERSDFDIGIIGDHPPAPRRFLCHRGRHRAPAHSLSDRLGGLKPRIGYTEGRSPEGRPGHL